MPSVASGQAKQIVSALAPLLKAAGFRKRRHSFNRATEASLTHVVDVQVGPFKPPGTQELPPFRVDLYGRFTVNLGVFVPSLHARLGYPPPRGWVNEHQCELRHRLGTLARGEDQWWQLNEVDAAVDDVGSLLSDVALPWLDRFRTRTDIIEAFFAGGRVPLGMTPAGQLHVGLLLLDEGETAQAERVIAGYLQDDLPPPHRRYLTEFLPQQGLGHLLSTA